MRIKIFTNKAMMRAAERSANSDMHVRRTAPGTYQVTNRQKGTSYEVRLFHNKNGLFGECACLAGSNGQACYHLIPALSLAKALASNRKA